MYIQSISTHEVKKVKVREVKDNVRENGEKYQTLHIDLMLNNGSEINLVMFGDEIELSLANK